MASSRQKGSLVRTIRLDDARVAEILARLDATDGGAAASKRGAERFPYRVTGCVVHIQQPGAASAVSYVVPTRNLSATGMSFLHGGFVHTGSTCMVQLITTHGTWEDVKAKVVRCNYIEGTLHEVGVRFDHEIKPGEFTDKARSYTALLADDEPMIARLATFHLKQLNVEVEHVTDGRQAVEKAMAGEFDIVFMDMDMPVLDGYAATKELREKGYSGLIVALTAHSEPGDKERCLHSGCDRYVAKPFGHAQLEDIIAVLREEPLVSDFHNDAAMMPLIEAFLDEMPGRLRALEEALTKQDLAAIRSQILYLKSGGSGHGYPPISEAALDAERALRDNAPFGDLKRAIDEVTKLCLLARASVPSVRSGASQAAARSAEDKNAAPRES